MLTYLNNTTNQINHVFTKDELLKTLNSVIDSARNTLNPNQLSQLQKLSDAIIQVYTRIDNLNETVDYLQKVNEYYKTQITSYAVSQSQRMKQAEQEKEPINPATEALHKINENM